MARYTTPTADQAADWATWVAQRPPILRDLIERYKFDPWTLYRLKTSGHRVTICSFDEPVDGSLPTLRVNVTGEFNFVAFERTVFGIQPDDLEECDLPTEGELLGSTNLTPEQAQVLAEEIRLRKN